MMASSWLHRLTLLCLFQSFYTLFSIFSILIKFTALHYLIHVIFPISYCHHKVTPCCQKISEDKFWGPVKLRQYHIFDVFWMRGGGICAEV
jgi:hypothetical protein